MKYNLATFTYTVMPIMGVSFYMGFELVECVRTIGIALAAQGIFYMNAGKK